MAQGSGIVVTHNAQTNTYTVSATGGSGSGQSGTFEGLTSVSWTSDHKLKFTRETITFSNGVYTGKTSGQDIDIETIPFSGGTGGGGGEGDTGPTGWTGWTGYTGWTGWTGKDGATGPAGTSVTVTSNNQGIVLSDGAGQSATISAYNTNNPETLHISAGGTSGSIVQKTIVGNSPISVSSSATQITISYSGSTGGSGYTTSGTEDTGIADIQYDTTAHQIQIKKWHAVYSNGILTTYSVDSTWIPMTGGQAVEETV